MLPLADSRYLSRSMATCSEQLAAQIRARQQLYELAHMVVLSTHEPPELARRLRQLAPRAVQMLPPRELDALATLVAHPHRG